VLESIAGAKAIIFAPSNPVTSIGPILAVPGIRDALRQTKARIAAVSPIVGGAAVSGPAAALMKMMGWPSTIAGVAKAYEDFLDVLVADSIDKAAASDMNTANLRVLCTKTIMDSWDAKRALARFTVEACAGKTA
jgi:LPPG:FO 2-phospho-L-lactate transferase